MELDFKTKTFFKGKFKKYKDCISKVKYNFFKLFFLLLLFKTVDGK